jgi:hypothetical protein
MIFDEKEGKEVRKLYERSFLHSETKKLFLKGSKAMINF